MSFSSKSMFSEINDVTLWKYCLLPYWPYKSQPCLTLPYTIRKASVVPQTQTKVLAHHKEALRSVQRIQERSRPQHWTAPWGVPESARCLLLDRDLGLFWVWSARTNSVPDELAGGSCLVWRSLSHVSRNTAWLNAPLQESLGSSVYKLRLIYLKKTLVRSGISY